MKRRVGFVFVSVAALMMCSCFAQAERERDRAEAARREEERARVEAERAKAEAEAARTRAVPEAPLPRAKFPDPRVVVDHLNDAKIDRARLSIFTIEQAAQKFFIANSEWPTELAALTTGDKPLLKKDDLTDPWGRPFQFKVVVMGDLEQFVVWSQGPDPANPKGHVHKPGRAP